MFTDSERDVGVTDKISQLYFRQHVAKISPFAYSSISLP